MCRYKSAYAEDFGKCYEVDRNPSVPLPTNYNDSDLETTMTQFPVERTGISDMSIILIQLRIVELLGKLVGPKSQVPLPDGSFSNQCLEEYCINEKHLVERTKSEIDCDILSRCHASRPFEWLILLIGKVIIVSSFS